MVDLPRDAGAALRETVAALESDEAGRSLARNYYWPKWDGPWWRMTLLREMGLVDAIPARAIDAMWRAVRAQAPPFFPLREEDVPKGQDPNGVFCHCALGNLFQILHARGVPLDAEAPWMREWFVKYQLPSGALHCDERVYLQPDPKPDSVVGMIGALEAVLLCTPRAFTPAEERFLDLGAANLIRRRLVHPLDASEAEDEEDWPRLCFPRFYFYDGLRGLSWLLRWAEVRATGDSPGFAPGGARFGTVPWAAIAEVVSAIEARFPDGRLRTERLSFEGVRTRRVNDAGEWERAEAGRFALLDALAPPGAESPHLSAEWADARARLARLRARGLVE